MSRHILTPAEVEHLIQLPKLIGPLGIRDRAILETLHATGLRAAELVNLRLYDLDRQRSLVLVRQDKGGRDHTVLLSMSAWFWIDHYMRETRSLFGASPLAGDVLFLTRRGRPFTVRELNELVRYYLAEAGIDKRGGCYLFRRTRAVYLS
jgi:integrase/recombinase XerD